MMGFWGVSNILLVTGLGIIGFFALNSAKEDNRTDIKEFFKLSGILISLSVLCVIFIDITFLFIQCVSWMILYLFSVLKDDIFTLQNGYLLTLLLVNAGGAYMVWELKKEREEEEKFKEETAGSRRRETDSAPVQEEDNTKESTAPAVETSPASPEAETGHEESSPAVDVVVDDDGAEKESPEDSTAEKTREETPDYEILKELDISHRVAKTLHEAGIDSAKDLTDNSIDQLKSMKNLGDKSLEEIQVALKKAELSLKAV